MNQDTFDPISLRLADGFSLLDSKGSPLKGRNVQIIVYERPGRKDLPADYVSIDDAMQHVHTRGVGITRQSLMRWISHGLGGHRLTAIRTRKGVFTTKELIDAFLRASSRLEIDTIRPLTGREEVAQMLKAFEEEGLEHGETLIESCDQLSDRNTLGLGATF